MGANKNLKSLYKTRNNVCETLGENRKAMVAQKQSYEATQLVAYKKVLGSVLYSLDKYLATTPGSPEARFWLDQARTETVPVPV